MKKKIEIGNRKYTNLEYDENEYEIEYFGKEIDVSEPWEGRRFIKENYFIVKNVKENKIINVFTGDISDIIQFKKDENNYFVVVSYPDKESSHSLITTYIDEGFDMPEIFKKEIAQCTRVSDHTFFLQLEGMNFALYNGEKFKKGFRTICACPSDYEKIKDVYGEDVLFVEEKLRPRYVLDGADIDDIITYGVDVDTLEIKTPIWSEIQQRYIKLLSEEEIEKREENYRKKNINAKAVYKSDSIGDKTIGLEVQLPLEEISLMMGRRPSIGAYVDGFGDKEKNKEFVKGFKN